MCVHGAVACFYPSGCHTSDAYKNTHSSTALYFLPQLPRHSFAVSIGWSIPRSLSSTTYPLPPADMMQLTPSFILILGILFRISLDAYAIPLAPEQRGVVTLPLKRTPMRRDLHPHMVCPLVPCSSKAYSDTIDQLLQMHNARAQRRLAHMTGRAVSSVELDRLTARNPDPSRIGYAGGKLNKNGPNASSKCEFLTFVFTSLSSQCTQRSF